MTNSSSTKSAEIIVSDDLLLEIFLRLPFRSFQRFITTNKQWQSLLTNPTFRKLWRKRNLRPATALFVRSCRPESTQVIPLSTNNPTTVPNLGNTFEDIIQLSSNGLLVCSNSTKNYYVYNPTTNMSFTLPVIDDVTPRMRIHYMGLAFDPNESPHYKVVCFVKNPKSRLYVYSSDTRRWKSVSEPLRDIGTSRGVYWNGAIHWLCKSYCFDIGNEVFKRMPELPYSEDTRAPNYFNVSCDRLNYTQVLSSKSPTSCIVHLYELKRDYSEWVLKHCVGLDYWFPTFFLISVVHGIEEDDSFFVLKTGSRIVRYNLVSKTSEELPFNMSNFNVTFQYVESQSSVC